MTAAWVSPSAMVFSNGCWGAAENMLGAKGKPIAEERPAVTITTEFGFRLVVDPQMPLLVSGPLGLRPTRASKVLPGDSLVAGLGWDRFGTSTALSPLVLPARTSSKPAFARNQLDDLVARYLGYLVAEGNLHKNRSSYSARVTVSLSDKDIADDLIKTAEHTFGSSNVKTWTSKGLQVVAVHRRDLYYWAASQLMGALSGDRGIPLCVLAAPKSIIAAFLSAFYAGDGSIWSTKGQVTSPIGTMVKSPILADQVHTLLWEMGIPAYRTTEVKPTYGSFHGVLLRSHRFVNRFMETIGFSSHRKQNFARPHVSRMMAAHGYDIPQRELEFLYKQSKGAAREKMRECLRLKKRVRFGDTRLPYVQHLVSAKRTPCLSFLVSHKCCTIKIRSRSTAEKSMLVPLPRGPSAPESIGPILLADDWVHRFEGIAGAMA